MVKGVTTITIDSEIKKTASLILKESGLSLSKFIENCLKQLIINNRKGGDSDV
jgi:antitoxin component of RelBE/YafQ-DinJ toxin-antitoxin module